MNEKNLTELGARLREEREAKGFKKNQMADLGGCANSSYTNYEEGLREPGASFLLNIAAKANVDIVYVLTGLRTDNTTKTNEEASLLQCFRTLTDREKLGVNRLLSTLSGVAGPMTLKPTNQGETE